MLCDQHFIHLPNSRAARESGEGVSEPPATATCQAASMSSVMSGQAAQKELAGHLAHVAEAKGSVQYR